jgi:hypothetical protein
VIETDPQAEPQQEAGGVSSGLGEVCRVLSMAELKTL